MFHHTSRLATSPIGAVALTSASSILLGRYTTSRTTAQVSNTTTKHVHTWVLNHHRQSTSTSLLVPNSITTIANPNLHLRSFKSTLSTTSNKKSSSYLEWYEGHLQANPVQTKMVTGSILWALGDAVAQIVPALFFDKDESNNDKGSSSSSKELVYDFPRTARAMVFGFAIHAPMSHLHFNFLEWMTVRGGFTGLSVPVFKAFMEQFVYWSWFSNSLYHGAMGAMQGMSIQQIYDRIADVLWDTQKAQWVFWIPVQLLNFRFVPVRHQLNVVLLTSVVWTALLSAWYPPEDDDVKKIEAEDKKEK